MKSKKVNPNRPCFCGSGKKYKECGCRIQKAKELKQILINLTGPHVKIAAMEHQRLKQQGLGNPINSIKTNDGQRIISVDENLFGSKKWHNFQEFLIDYLKEAMGVEWSEKEIKSSHENKHKIFRWFEKICEYQLLISKDAKNVADVKMTGAVAAYMHLAYDLYVLKHNSEIQNKLIDRLKNHDNFSGARYELQVAAILIKAGFDLAFENEDDREKTHCEFVATCKSTLRKFSVEAKYMEGDRIVRPLLRALKKHADHSRIIFIDLNFDVTHDDYRDSPYLKNAIKVLTRFETRDPQAEDLPPAYIFLTNSPWERHLEETEKFSLRISGSFKIDDFKPDYKHPSVQASLQSRKNHIEIFELLESIQDHSKIPITFDGSDADLPDAEKRLLIGNRYSVQDQNGRFVSGIITTALVLNNSRTAMCTLVADDGISIVFHESLTDKELKAYRRHPKTFFGRISDTVSDEKGSSIYKMLMPMCIGISKEELIELLKSSNDVNEIKDFDQSTLVHIYCERESKKIEDQGKIIIEKSFSNNF